MGCILNSMDRVLLIVATISLTLNTLWGLYMRMRVIPTWFTDPPASFTRIRTKAPPGWIPLQALFAVSFIGALVLNWNSGTIRLYMLLTLLCYAVIGVSTGTYFIKEILAFSKMDKTTLMTPELQTRAKRWQLLTTGRNVLQVIGMLLLFLACLSL